MREARKHAAWYVKGIRGAAKYRAELVRIDDYGEMLKTLEKIRLEIRQTSQSESSL